MPAPYHTDQPTHARMVIFQHGRYKSLHRCPPTFADAAIIVRGRFKIAAVDDIDFFIDADALGVAGDVGEVALAPDSWDALFQALEVPVITVRSYASESLCKPSTQKPTTSPPPSYNIDIYIYYESHCFTLQVLDSLTMWDICCKMAHWLGLDAESLDIYQHGSRLSSRETVLGAGIGQNDVLWLR